MVVFERNDDGSTHVSTTFTAAAPTAPSAAKAMIVARKSRVTKFTESAESSNEPVALFDSRCAHSNPKKGGRCKGYKGKDSDFCPRHTCERFACTEFKLSGSTSCERHQKVLRKLSARRSQKGKDRATAGGVGGVGVGGARGRGVNATMFPVKEAYGGSKASVPNAGNIVMAPANAYTNEDGDEAGFGFGAAFAVEADAEQGEEVYNQLGVDVDRTGGAAHQGANDSGEPPRPSASMYEDE